MGRVAGVATLVVGRARCRARWGLGGGGRAHGVGDGLAIAIAEVVAAIDDVAGLAVGVLVCWVA